MIRNEVYIMKILTRDNVVLFCGEVEKGVFPVADPSRELYRINGSMYSVTDGIVEHDVDSVPEDFTQGKYCYTEADGFYINPDFVAETSPEERLAELEAEIERLKQELTTR